MKPRHKSYVMLLAVVLIWGIASSVIKMTLTGIDPHTFLAYRFVISALVAIGIILFTQRKHFRSIIKNIIPYSTYGVLVAISLTMLFVGLDNSGVLDLALVAAIGPLAISFGGYKLFHDHITRRERIGIFIALVGVFLNSLAPILLGDEVRLTGNIFLILYLLFDATSALFSKKQLRMKKSPLHMSQVGFIAATIFLVVFAVYKVGLSEMMTTINNLSLYHHLGVWYMALISGTLAYFLVNKSLKSIEVSEAALFSYLTPLVSIPFALFWVGETITISFTIGALVIAIGLFIAETKPNLKKS